jgi:hypothetical protein
MALNSRGQPYFSAAFNKHPTRLRREALPVPKEIHHTMLLAGTA